MITSQLKQRVARTQNRFSPSEIGETTCQH